MAEGGKDVNEDYEDTEKSNEADGKKQRNLKRKRRDFLGNMEI